MPGPITRLLVSMEPPLIVANKQSHLYWLAPSLYSGSPVFISPLLTLPDNSIECVLICVGSLVCLHLTSSMFVCDSTKVGKQS